MLLLIAESNDFSARALARLRENFDVVRERDLSREQLREEIRDADVLWVRLRNKIDQAIIDAAPRLHTIVTNTTGLNHIDCDYVRRRNIEILSLRGESAFLQRVRGTAEMTIGLMLALLRKIPSAHESVLQKNWDRYPFQGREIFEKVVGIIGYGRLGCIVARYLVVLGAKVLVTDIRTLEEACEDVEVVDLDELLARSHIVSLHASYDLRNTRMIGAREFEQMQAGAYFINTARGELVDELALHAALESGHLAGAALDVLDNEHALTLATHPLVQYAKHHDNLILTPHIGGNTFESMEATECFLAEKLIAHMQKTATAHPIQTQS